MLTHLRRLQARWRERLRKRKRQMREARRTGKAGHLKAAARHGRAARKLAGLIRRAKAELYSVAAGFPFWGGSKFIVATEVRPIVQRAGHRVTSNKRWETFGNPGSDHHRSQRLAYAEDYDAVEAHDLATQIRRELTGDPNAVHSDYEAFYIERRGHTYRVQIIAGTHGTGPHLHVGVERVS